MKRVLFVLLSGLLLLLLPSAAAAATPTFDQAVNSLIAHSYPQTTESYLDSLGDTALGFRLAGSPADNAAADYLTAQFQAMGLANVRQEGVPVDAWDMQGAWVRAAGHTMTASQFDGVPGTNATLVRGAQAIFRGPVTAPVVYAGYGTLADYQGKDVTGKIVLVNLALDSFWMNFQGHLAAEQGALAVIATYGPNSFPWYAGAYALGANDAEYDMSYAPMVYISRADGKWLKSRLAGGPVTATVSSNVNVTMHDFADPSNGGLGFNVVGEIAGSDPHAKAILIAAHHDAHFRAGLDDTGAVANLLMIAKAMKMSHYKPVRSIIFLVTTGEEFGYTNCWYDWCAGAWYAATVTHGTGTADPWTGPDGRLAAMFNLELMARKGAKLSVGASSALAPWVRLVALAHPQLVPNGIAIETPISSWEDGWTFTAAGVPALVMEAGGANYDQIYHSTYETKALVDYAYLGKIAKFTYQLTTHANAGLLPYRLHAQADGLRAAVSRAELLAAGADPATVNAAINALVSYHDATVAYEKRKATIPASHRATVNTGLFDVENYWNTHLTGLDIWDYQAYPFQQTLWDIEALNAALTALRADPVKKDAALDALSSVALTYNGMTFGETVYADDLVRHLPDYPLITWGGQIDTPWHVDILAQVDQVKSGDYATAITGLTAVRDAEITGIDIRGYSGPVHINGLNQRLVDVSAALNHMTPIVKALK